ncbi:MAG: hypothetical protein ACE5I2_06635 [Anaerolineae bacterium]
MKRILWCIFSLALILSVLLSANLAESLASFKNIGIIEGDRAGIIEGDLCPRSARIIEGDFSRSAGTLEGNVVPSI